MAPPALTIQSASRDVLSLTPTRRSYPDAADFWDGNWLKVDVDVRAGAFRGSYEADLRTDDFARFRDQLAAIQTSLRGEAALECIEPWIEVRVTIDKLGHMEARCRLRNDPGGIGPQLAFDLTFDQTDLSPILSGLDAVCQAFPVVGKPSK